MKERIPGLTLRTTFITGYPAETEKDFNELCDFVKEFEFDRFGAFTFSVEENTPSYLLGDPVPNEIKEERKAILMELQRDISFKKNKNFIGQKLKVIIDGKDEEYYIGRTERDAPEVDGEVLISAKNTNLTVGRFYTVDIFDCNDYDLFAHKI